jgi:uncharacterized protein YbaR (Trm112 family)
MQADPNNKDIESLEAWANELACPACFGALRLGEAAAICAGCGRIYPVVDGIPVLIPERAESSLREEGR